MSWQIAWQGTLTVGADADDLSMEEEEEPDPSFSRMSTAESMLHCLALLFRSLMPCDAGLFVNPVMRLSTFYTMFGIKDYATDCALRNTHTLRRLLAQLSLHRLFLCDRNSLALVNQTFISYRMSSLG